MPCPRCQHENRPQAKFCEECGTPLTANPSGPPAPSYAEITSALSEALEQQTATAEILRVIASSPTDVQPVFEAIVGKRAQAVRALRDGVEHRRERCFTPGRHAQRPSAQTAAREPASVPVPLSRRQATDGAVLEGGRSCHEPDVAGDPEYAARDMAQAIGATGASWPCPCSGRARPSARCRVLGAEAGAVHRPADRATRDVRRPGGDRHRERAAVQGAAGAEPRSDRGAGAADGDERDPPRHHRARRPTSSRSSTPSSRSAVRLCEAT